MGSNDDSSRENLNGIPRNVCASLTAKLWGDLCRNGEADEARMEKIGRGIFVKATSQPFRCPLLAEVFARLYRWLEVAEGGEVAKRFRRVLLDACETSFNNGVEYEKSVAERGAKEDPQCRACSLGTMRLLAELFSQRIISESILHGAITKLLCSERPNPGHLGMLTELLTHVVAHAPRVEQPGRLAGYVAQVVAMAETLPDAALRRRLLDLLQRWQTQGATVPQEARGLDGEGEAVSSPAPLGREGEAAAQPMAEAAPQRTPVAPPPPQPHHPPVPVPAKGPESGALGPSGSSAVPGPAAAADVSAPPPVLRPPVSPNLAQRALLDVIRGDDVDFPVPLPLLLSLVRDTSEPAREFLTVLCAGPLGLTQFAHFVRDTLGIFPEEFACCILWPLDGTVLLRKLPAPPGPNCPPPPLRPFSGCRRTVPLPRNPIPIPGPAALPHPLPPPCPYPQFWPTSSPERGPLAPGLAVPLALAAAASAVPAPPALTVDAATASIPQGAGADEAEKQRAENEAQSLTEAEGGQPEAASAAVKEGEEEAQEAAAAEEEQEQEEEVVVANDPPSEDRRLPACTVGPALPWPAQPAATADVVPGPVQLCQLTVKLVGLAAAIQLAHHTAAPTPTNPIPVASGLHAQAHHEVGLEGGKHQSPPAVMDASGSNPQDVSSGREPPSKDEGSTTPKRVWEATSYADEGRRLPAERTPRHRGPERGAQRSPRQPPDYGIQEVGSGLARIFVNGMKETITEAEVLAYFSRIGPVHRVLLKQNDKGRPYAFVDIAATDFATAITITEVFDPQAAGVTEGDTKLHVDRALTREERQKQREDRQLLERYGRGNLFVSNLDKAVDEPALRAAFEEFGEIVCAKVADKSGWAFVCFKDPEDAQRASQEMDGTWLGRRQLRVTTVHEATDVTEGRQKVIAERTLRKREKKKGDHVSGKLFVGNLHKTIDTEALRTAFEHFGEIHSVQVLNRDGFKGCGFVCFKNAKDAECAVQFMDGTCLAEKELRIVLPRRMEASRQLLLETSPQTEDKSSSEEDVSDPAAFSDSPRTNNRQQERQEAEVARILILGMKETITEAEVLAFFSRLVPVHGVVLEQNAKGRYALVDVDIAHWAKAITIAEVFDLKAAGLTESNNKIYVDPSLPRAHRMRQWEASQVIKEYGRGNLFVWNLYKATDEAALLAAFEIFGEVVRVKVEIVCRSHCGFVCFKDPAAAQRAKQTMDGAWLAGRQLQVTEAQFGQEDEKIPQLESRGDDAAASVKSPKQTPTLGDEDVDVVLSVSPPPPRPPLSVALTPAGATTSLCVNARPPDFATLHPKFYLEADGFRRVVEVPAMGTTKNLEAKMLEARNSASPGDAASPTAASQPGPVPPPADVGAGEADGRPEGGADRQPHGSRLMTHAPAAAPRPRGVHHTDGLRGMCQDLQQLYGRCLEGGQQTLQCLAVHCWATPHDTLLLRVATPRVMYVLDVARLGAAALREALRPFLECKHLYKVMHDLRPAAAYLQRLDIRPRSLLDVQLLCEHLTGKLQCDMSDVLQQCGVASSPAGLPEEERAAWDLAGLAAGCPALLSRLGEALPVVATASLQRAVSIANGDPYDPWYGLVCFDRSRDYRLASYELLRATRPDDVLTPSPAVVDHSGTREVLGLLPASLRPAAQRLAATVTTVVLDVGRPPQVFCGAEAVDLAEDEAAVVTPEDVGGVVQAAGAGSLETSDCVAFPGVLHRVSCLRNQKGYVSGLTFRVVRPVTGLAYVLYDVLKGRPHHNVLFLGEPRSGKSTALRDVARLMSESLHVLAVDTHGDLGGVGPKPHPSLGKARRVTPPSLAGQALVMAEAVQRERPEVLVVDQVHRKTELDVLRMAQRCGVRLAVGAGAAGSLRQLLHCRPLAGMLGVEMQEVLGRGLAPRRTAAPIFDCVVVLRRAAPGEWTVISNVAEVVDDALKGKPYRVSVRSHDLETGLVRHSALWM